jgi:phospholipid-binding lipoprotein MlaA
MMAVMAAAAATFLGCASQNQRLGMMDVRGSSDTRALQSPRDLRVAQAGEGRDYDPLEPFNERMFWFNHDVLDRYGLRPAATVWNRVVPEPVTQCLENAFDNLEMPKRFVNNVLQGRLEGADREVTRFLVNSTVGVAGFFDVATRVGFRKSSADTGQTLGVYGVAPGPYLVVPLMQPLTLRDGIGYAVDAMLDPIGYFAPFAANFARSATKRVSQRAASMDLYQDVEDSSLDLYAAVRNGYLQRRQQNISNAIREGRRERAQELSVLRKILFIEDTSAAATDNAGGEGNSDIDSLSGPQADKCSRPEAEPLTESR